jgi:hypothetical protein
MEQNLTVGAIIGVLCEVQQGPFSEDRMISFDTVDGPVTGFVRENELRKDGNEWRVRAVVLAIQNDEIEVRIRGSFFTTNGIATIPATMAYAA